MAIEKIKVSRVIPRPKLPEGDIQERLIMLSHRIGAYVEYIIQTGGLDSNNQFVPINELQKSGMFTGPDYDALLEANPIWAPSKPEGLFRESDIFKFLDYKESIK